MLFNANVFYRKCLKLIEQAYQRLKRIESLPEISLTQRQGRFYDDHGHLLSTTMLKKVQRQLKQKVRLLNLNKQLKKSLKQSIQVLQIFDRRLSFFLKKELMAYCLDEIPLKSRASMLKVFTNSSVNQATWKRWVRGEIQAREIALQIVCQTAN